MLKFQAEAFFFHLAVALRVVLIEECHFLVGHWQSLFQLGKNAKFEPFRCADRLWCRHPRDGTADRQVELEEYDNERLNHKFAELMTILDSHPEITVSYFKPDERKAGGAYAVVSGHVKKIDTYEQYMEMEDGIIIPIRNIIDLQF